MGNERQSAPRKGGWDGAVTLATFGRALAVAVTVRGQTRTTVAKALGTTRDTVSSWLADRHQPSVARAQALARLLWARFEANPDGWTVELFPIGPDAPAWPGALGLGDV